MVAAEIPPIERHWAISVAVVRWEGAVSASVRGRGGADEPLGMGAG